MNVFIKYFTSVINPATKLSMPMAYPKLCHRADRNYGIELAKFNRKFTTPPVVSFLHYFDILAKINHRSTVPPDVIFFLHHFSILKATK